MSAPETADESRDVKTGQGDTPATAPDPQKPPPVPPLAEDLVGTVISERYKIEKVLGKGGMGAVYLVQHVHMRKHYALKMLHAETSQNPELVARFEREAVASAHAEHPNITVATDFGRTDNGGFFLVLEYLEGKRLRDILNSGPLDAKRAVHIARQVACALEVSHGLGIVHRDLKPENIMLVNRQGDSDFVKVLDFGLAKVATDSLQTASDEPLETITRHGSIFGTPRYMAPEQCVGDSVDGRTDLYALGMVLYEMLAGIHPFDGSGVVQLVRQQLSKAVPPFTERAPNVVVPIGLQAVVLKLVEKKAEQRYADAKELIAALDALALDPAAKSSASPSKTPSAQDALTRPVTASALMLEAVAEPPITATRPPLSSPTVGAFDAAKVDKPATETAPAADPLPAWLAKLPPPLRERPALLLLPLLLLGGLLFLILRPSKAPTPQVRTGAARTQPQPVAPSEIAGPEPLKQAVEGGLPALLELEKRFARDANVKRKIAHMFMAQNNGLEAMRWMGKALPLDETVIFDGEIVQAVNMASSSPEGHEAAITLLETDFGARGVDILIALSGSKTSGGRGKAKSRVQQSLAKPEVRAHASPAALIALDLRNATKCEAKRALLGRAAQDGDGRTLAQLKALTQTRGCGTFDMNDCWSCLRQDGALQAAINSVSVRASVTH